MPVSSRPVEVERSQAVELNVNEGLPHEQDVLWRCDESMSLPIDGLDHCCFVRKAAISSLHFATHRLS